MISEIWPIGLQEFITLTAERWHDPRQIQRRSEDGLISVKTHNAAIALASEVDVAEVRSGPSDQSRGHS